jgi:MFS family permease
MVWCLIYIELFRRLTQNAGCAQIWTNYINRPLPKGGNGWGAVAAGSQATQGALGLGEQIANATSQSFSLIAYCLPLVVGYLADSRFGRYPMIFWGIILCGIGHVLIVAGGAKTLIENDTAKIPFFIGVYILAVGAGKFGANLTPRY